jgi:PQQ-like domain
MLFRSIDRLLRSLIKASQLIVGLAVVILGGANARADNWGSYQHDPAHTGRTHSPVNPTKLSLAWTAPEYSSPLIVGDTLYAKRIYDLSTDVTAFAVADGAVLWTYSGIDVYFGNLAIGGSFAVLEGFDFSGGSSDTLRVLDRQTGQLLYAIELPLSFSFLDPTLVRDPETGAITAYCSDGATIVSVALGRNSGRIVWTQSGDLGSSSVPTIVGDSVIVFGAFAGSAFDRTTGAQHIFYTSPSSANHGAPVSYNADRSDFYVRLDYASEGVTNLLAFHYDGNDSIQLLWTRSKPLHQLGGGVAIGDDDTIYVVGSDEIALVDPDDGSTRQSIVFPFANGSTPALSRRVLWVDSETQTLAFDAASLVFLQVFDTGNNFGLGFDSPGAFVPGTAALKASHANFRDLDVYRQVPSGR